MNASLNAVVSDISKKIKEQEEERIAQDAENASLRSDLQVRTNTCAVCFCYFFLSIPTSKSCARQSKTPNGALSSHMCRYAYNAYACVYDYQGRARLHVTALHRENDGFCFLCFHEAIL